MSLSQVLSEGFCCQGVPCPSVRIHRMVFGKTGTSPKPVPETFWGALWNSDARRFGAESHGRVESLKGLQHRESYLLQMLPGRLVTAPCAESCDSCTMRSSPFH